MKCIHGVSMLKYCGDCIRTSPVREVKEAIDYWHQVAPKPITPMGWECPRCHKVNAPTILSCDCAATRLAEGEGK